MACSFATFLDELGYTKFCALHDIDYEVAISLWHKFKSDITLAWRMLTFKKWHSIFVAAGTVIGLTLLPISYYKYYKTQTALLVWSILFVFVTGVMTQNIN